LQTEFSNIVKDRDVVALLNSLDRLIHEARLRKQSAESQGNTDAPIPPHTLPPSDLVNAHLATFLTDTRTTITNETAELEKRNLELMQTIKQQRQEMEGLVVGLENVVKDLERSAEMVQGDDVVGLTAEVKMVEEELKT
jgi:kinetochore protein NNF1